MFFTIICYKEPAGSLLPFWIPILKDDILIVTAEFNALCRLRQRKRLISADGNLDYPPALGDDKLKRCAIFQVVCPCYLLLDYDRLSRLLKAWPLARRQS